MKLLECLGCAVLTAAIIGGTYVGIKYFSNRDANLDIDTLG